MEKKSSRLFQDFVGYTTLHGFHFVATNSNAAIRRLIWFVLMLSALTFLTFQLISSFEKLNSNRHVVHKNVIHEKDVVFPAFTLCNINMMKKSKIQGTQAKLYQDMFSHLSAMKDVSENKTLNSSFNLEKAVLDAGHTAKDMVKSCVWKGQNCSYRNFTTSYSYMYGLCHTFNLGTNNQPLLSSTSTKKDQGLILSIFIDYQEYYGLPSSINSGVVFALHNQNDNHRIEEHGTILMPGFLSTIKIKRKMIERLPPPFSSACGRRKLVTSSVYTRNKCVLECQTREITRRCGCRMLGLPVLPDSNISSYCLPSQMIKCGLLRGNNDLSKNIVNDYGILEAPECDCPESCQEIKYDSNLNIAYYPSNTFFDYNNKDIPVSSRPLLKRLVRENTMVVIAYYEDLTTDVTTERRAYDISDFGSDVGGNLGLFLGCSILTVVEFLDFLIVSFTAKYCSAKKQVLNREKGYDIEDQQNEKETGINNDCIVKMDDLNNEHFKTRF